MITEYSYNNRDNTVDLLLKADGVAEPLDSVNRMVLIDKDGNVLVDENTSPGAFSRSADVTGKVVLSLGNESLTAGSYYVHLVVYDPDNTDGIVWNNQPFLLIVK